MVEEKQKILYDATFIAENVNPKSRTGIYFVAYNTLNLMLERPDLEIDLYCESNQYGNLLKILEEIFPKRRFNIITELHNIKLAAKRARLREKREKYKANKKRVKKIWIQILQFINSIAYNFSRFLAEHRNYNYYNIFFSPMYKVPNFLAKYKNIKKCVFVHDVVPLIYPEYFPNYEKHWHKHLMDSMNSEEYYFANSEYTRQDFLKHCPQIDPNKIYTTLLACDEKFRPCDEKQIEQAKSKYNIPTDKKYVFSLCTLEPRKNLIRTVKSFIQFIKKHNIEDMVFVLGGGSWEIFIDKLNKEIDDLGDFQDKILKIGYVADEDLAPLYSGAEWFTYTSQYEGFGLPPLEAMSCGTPVITSNNSSLPEVVGDTGIMIDCDSDEQHIEAYEKYYFNGELRKEYAQKGLERAKQFSWEKCVDEMLEKIC